MVFEYCTWTADRSLSEVTDGGSGLLLPHINSDTSSDIVNKSFFTLLLEMKVLIILHLERTDYVHVFKHGKLVSTHI